MSEPRERVRYRNRGCRGCGGGCASFIVVITVGLVLTLFNLAIGVGVSVRVPFTSDVNVTLAGTVGSKDKAPQALPPYARGRLADNRDFVNGTQTLTVWVAEGTVLFLIGHQEGAPVIDLHLEAR